MTCFSVQSMSSWYRLSGSISKLDKWWVELWVHQDPRYPRHLPIFTFLLLRCQLANAKGRRPIVWIKDLHTWNPVLRSKSSKIIKLKNCNKKGSLHPQNMEPENHGFPSSESPLPLGPHVHGSMLLFRNDQKDKNPYDTNCPSQQCEI